MSGGWQISRRSAIAAVLLVSCKAADRTGEDDGRCGFCGMKIDPASAFRCELTVAGKTLHFDAPKCALSAWRQKNLAVESSRFQEFYTRVPTDAAKLVFARGGDVIGPMGADLVPLDPPSAPRFVHDHGARDTLTLAEITSELLRTI